MINQPFGQALADETGRITQVNRVLCDLLGLDVRALLERGIHDITHYEDWPGNGQKLDRLRKQDEPFTIVKRYVRADGSMVWVQNYVSMLRDAEGRPTMSALIRPVLPAVGEARRWGEAKPPALSPTELHAMLRPRIGPNGVLH
ncbi:PAS domain S-box protein [Roseomonas sp. SSH11]|uniref:PAS domain S-box protein n=1 Tax=Pararoseomonas baculiformis TaxID=2820812 RepID=A0ABS4AAK9_9PROT|nr:PAS domain S-box protein [Pararoseomonas baculiformis]MBP0443543.1 PAS domain S-box protein [Pararoseomonas baculiformis]